MPDEQAKDTVVTFPSEEDFAAADRDHAVKKRIGYARQAAVEAQAAYIALRQSMANMRMDEELWDDDMEGEFASADGAMQNWIEALQAKQDDWASLWPQEFIELYGDEFYSECVKRAFS